MGNRFKRAMQPDLNIYNDKMHIDFNKLRRMVGANQGEIARILGLSEATIKANKGSVASDKKANPLTYALQLLAPLCDADEDLMRAWFVGAKVYWSGLSPLEMFALQKGDQVIETLKAMTEGEGFVGG